MGESFHTFHVRFMDFKVMENGAWFWDNNNEVLFKKGSFYEILLKKIVSFSLLKINLKIKASKSNWFPSKIRENQPDPFLRLCQQLFPTINTCSKSYK